MKMLTTMISLSAILILRYYVMAWLFQKATGSMTPIDSRPVNEKAKKQDLKYSIISSVIFAASGTFLLWTIESGISKIYFSITEYSFLYLAFSTLLYLVLHDTYYYWMHRALHHQSLLRFHYVHHVSRRPTAWTSFSFHPLEAFFQSLFIPLMTLWMPIHLGALIGILMVMTFFGFTNHLGTEIYPDFFEKRLHLITANHHQKHHQFPDRNFGLYFTFWDKWANTESRRPS